MNDTELLEAIIEYGLTVSKAWTWDYEPVAYRVSSGKMGRFLSPDLPTWREAIVWAITWIRNPDQRESLDSQLAQMTFKPKGSKPTRELQQQAVDLTRSILGRS